MAQTKNNSNVASRNNDELQKEILKLEFDIIKLQLTIVTAVAVAAVVVVIGGLALL